MCTQCFLYYYYLWILKYTLYKYLEDQKYLEKTKGNFLTTERLLGVQPQLGRPAQCPLFRLPLYFWAFLEI